MISRLSAALALTAIAMALFCASAFATSNDANEPNESPASATGPLVGGQLYQGAIDSAVDRDYFYFYTAGAGTFNAAILDYGDPWNLCRKDLVAMTAGGDLLDYETSWGSYDIYGGGAGSPTVLSFATTSAAKIYVRITGEPSAYCWDASSIYYSGPDKYTIRALPADAIASSLPAPSPPAPAPPSEKCVEAKTALGKDADVIKKLKKSIAGSTGSKQHRLRVKLKKLRKDFAGANDAAGKYC